MKTDIKSIEKELSLVEKAELLKNKIVENANALADRILTKAIKKEESEQIWKSRKEELKAKYDKLRKDAAILKRKKKAKIREERIKTLMNKTIPTITPELTKNQDKLEEEHKEKLLKKQEKRKERLKIAAINKVHHKEKKVIKHVTKEQKIAEIKEKKQQGYQNYKKELERQSSEIMADRQGYADRIKKREKSEAERLEMLAKRRIDRMKRLQIVELSHKQKMINDLKHFKEAQLARIKKKEEKRAKYLTKGGIKVPKVKNKVEARSYDIRPIDKIEFNKYKIIISKLSDAKEIIDNEPFELTCLAKDLSKRMKDYHNVEMKKDKSTHVGIFAYDINQSNYCVHEMINNDYLSINGVLTSRLAKNKKDNKVA